MTAYISLYINGKHDKTQRGGGGGKVYIIEKNGGEGRKSRKGPSTDVKSEKGREERPEWLSERKGGPK